MGSTETALTYDDALAVFLTADASYAGGLANHGPMAVEALVSIGVPTSIASFVEHYRHRLEPATHIVEPAPVDWQAWLAPQLVQLVPHAANLAGHGLLRVAHAVRGIERAEATGAASLNQRHELAAAVEYWRSGGAGLPSPVALTGAVPISEWLGTVEHLPPAERADGLLTLTLAAAADTPGFVNGLERVAASANPAATLDLVGLAAADAFARNQATSAFALLHGATVSNMARVLLAHLDEAGQRRLESAVVGFVAAAVIGFDDGPGAAARTEDSGDLDVEGLAQAAAATNEDHTITFADACLGLAKRTGSRRPLGALHQQITRPYGL